MWKLNNMTDSELCRSGENMENSIFITLATIHSFLMLISQLTNSFMLEFHDRKLLILKMSNIITGNHDNSPSDDVGE